MKKFADIYHVFDSLPQAAVALDCAGNVVFLNARAETLFGWHRQELLGLPCPFFSAQPGFKSGSDEKSLWMSCKDRSRLRLKVRVSSWRNDDGEVNGTVYTFDEPDSASQGMDDPPNPYRDFAQFFKRGPGVFFRSRASGDFGATYVSENVRELLGHRPECFTEDAGFWLANIHPDDIPTVKEHLGTLLETGQAKYEYRFRHVDGSYRWMYDESRVIAEAGGKAEEIAGYWVDITERREMEEALKASEDRFHRFFELAPDAIYLHSLDGTFIDGNSAAERMIGYRREELIGGNFFSTDLIPARYHELVANLLLLATAGKTVGPVELELIHRDGTLVPLEVRILPIEIGGQLQVLGIARDISERKRSEELLRKTRKCYQMIADHTPVILYTLDRTGMFTFAEGAGLLHIDPRGEGLVGQNVHSRFGGLHWHQPNRVFTVSEVVDRALSGEHMTGIVHLADLDRYFETQLVPIREDPGPVIGLMGLALDVTERYKAELGVRRWQERFKAVVSNAPVVLFSLDKEGRFTFSEGKGLDRSGLKDGEIVGRTVDELYGDMPFVINHENIIPGSEAFQRVLQGEAISGVTRIEPAIYDTRLFPTYNGRGEVIGIHGISVDITDRCQAEDELRSSEQKFRHISNEFRTVLDGIPDSLSLLSPDLKVVWANRGAARGYGEHVPKELSCHQLWGMETRSCPDCPVRRAFSSKKTESTTMSTPDGRTWGIKAFPLEGENGCVTGVIEWASDITERIRLQEEAIHASRLASLGELAAGVAHEINNPNALVLLNAPILVDTWPDISGVLDRHLQDYGDFRVGRLPYSRLREIMPSLHADLLEGAQRIRRIVEDLKDFVRQDDGQVQEPVDLNETVNAALRLLSNTIRKNTNHLVVELDDCLPMVTGNFQRLEQVVINLVLNACQALPSTNLGIKISTSLDQPRKRLLFRVEDEGRGILPEHLDRLTEPFLPPVGKMGGPDWGFPCRHALSTSIKENSSFNL